MGKTRTILIRDGGSSLELSVNPESITISDSRDNIKETIDAIGDVYFPGKRGLKSLDIATFLPSDKSHFRKKGSLDKDLKKIDRWLKSERPVRVIISRPAINIKMLLDSASITLKEGDRDVDIALKFTEFKDITIPILPKKQSESEGGAAKAPELLERTADTAPTSGAVEVVTSKTTLWNLAKKYYGNGGEWKRIAAANGNVDPKKLREGMKLVIP